MFFFLNLKSLYWKTFKMYFETLYKFEKKERKFYGKKNIIF
jgi:hypothetical protein